MKKGKENYISPQKLSTQIPSQSKSPKKGHDKYGGSKFSFGNYELLESDNGKNLKTSMKETNQCEREDILTVRLPNEFKERAGEKNFHYHNSNLTTNHFVGHRRRDIDKEKNTNVFKMLNIHEDHEMLSSGLPSTKLSLLSETNSIQSNEKVLSVFKIGTIHYSPRREDNDPTYDEMKKLLEITEQEFDANQKLRILEKENSELAGLKCYENSLENKVKQLQDSLGETVSLLKSLQTKLEQTNFQNKSIIETFSVALELDAIIIQENPHNEKLRGQKEKLAELLNKEIQTINKISTENDLYIEAIAQIDVKIMKYKDLDEKGSNIVFKLQEQVRGLQERLEDQERAIKRLNEKISEQDKLLNDQEGLKSTTRKIIELQKAVGKSEQEKEDMEKYQNLLKQKLQNKEEDHIKLEDKYKELERKYLQSSALSDRAQEEEEAEWNSVAKEYIQKIENELEQSKEHASKLLQENSILKSKEYSSTDIFGEKVGKINEGLKIENQALKDLLQCKTIPEATKSTLRHTPTKNIITENKVQTKDQKLTQDKDKGHSQKKDLGKSKIINPNGHQTQLAKCLFKIKEERSRLKEEAMGRLSEAFLGKNKLFSISDSAKKLIKDIYEQEVSTILDINERKVQALKEKELNLLEILRVEIDRHVNTLRNVKQCLDPLYELLSLAEEISPLELGKSEVGRYALSMQKRRQEVFLAVKYAKETQQRLKSLWNDTSLFGKGHTIESDISFQEMYHSLETKLNNPKNKEQFKNQTPEEIKFLERRVGYLSERVESLTYYNHDLLQQLEKTKEQLTEIHIKHGHMNGSLHQTGQIKQAEISFSCDSLSQFQKNPEDNQKEGFQSLVESSSKHSEDRKSLSTNYLSFEDAREMLMAQATMIEGWLNMINAQT